MSEADQSPAIAEARGLHGQLEPLRDDVRIRREGFLAKSKGHDKEMAIREIVSLQFREAGFVTHGHIRFVLQGWEGSVRASSDEDTVQFHFWERSRLEAMKRAIERRIKESRKSG